MSATITVTGSAGAGNTLTAAVFTDVTSFEFDCVNNLLNFKQSTTPTVGCVAITDATTITATKSGSTYTLVVS